MENHLVHFKYIPLLLCTNNKSTHTSETKMWPNRCDTNEVLHLLRSRLFLLDQYGCDWGRLSTSLVMMRWEWSVSYSPVLPLTFSTMLLTSTPELFHDQSTIDKKALQIHQWNFQCKTRKPFHFEYDITQYCWFPYEPLLSSIVDAHPIKLDQEICCVSLRCSWSSVTKSYPVY